MSDIIVRPARENEIDLLSVVIDRFDQAFLEKGLWEIRFPGTEEYRLSCLRALLRSKSRSKEHFSSFWIAEIDGEVAGAVSASRPADYAAESAQAMEDAFRSAGWDADEVKQMYERILPISETLLQPSPKSWVIDYPYTLPSHRLKGVMKNMLLKVLQEGLQKGARRSESILLIGNTPAFQLFNSLGYLVKEEKSSKNFEQLVGVPGFYRISRPL